MTSGRSIRVGTRSSALALWQAHHVADALRRQPGCPAVEIVHIRTEGDVRTDVPLWAVDGRAFFTKEIDRALLANEIDVAVHSLKDVSTVLETGLQIGAVLEREDPRDALISRTGARLTKLPARARVGTSSLRRRAFLARARPDVVPMELRGNVPTRIERLRRGDYDAIILATAGLRRLGLEEEISERLPVEIFPPAASQGAICVSARADDAEVLHWLKPLDHEGTRLAVTAERVLLRAIEGGCQVPVGAFASLSDGRLRLQAAVCALDGSVMLTAEGDEPGTLEGAVALGERLASELLSGGAGEIIKRERTTRRTVESP